MRLFPLVPAFLLCLTIAACAQSRTPALQADEAAANEKLLIRVLDAEGNQMSGVRVEPSWTAGTVTTAGEPAVVSAGRGDLILRPEGGEVVILPWTLPVADADVEISLRPMKAKAGKQLSLALPVQMGTGFVWHALRSDSGCKQGALNKRKGDSPTLAGGSGTQQFLCPSRKAGGHAESFILARFASDGGRTYPTTQDDRPLYHIAIFLISVR